MSIEDRYIDLSDSLIGIANLYFYRGRLNDALELLKQSITTLYYGDVPAQAHFTLKLTYGSLLSQHAWLVSGDYDPANAIVDELQPFVETDIQRGQLLGLKGNILRQQALNAADPDFATPRQLFEESLTLIDRNTAPKAYFWSLFRMGICDQFIKDYDSALHIFRDAQIIARKYEFLIEQSYVVRHLGFVYQFTNRLEDALEALKQSLDLRIQLDFKIFLAMSYLAVAGVHDKLGNRDEALENYAHATQASDMIGYARPRMISYANYGNLLYETGQFDDARAALTIARPLAQEVQHHSALALIDELLTKIDTRT